MTSSTTKQVIMCRGYEESAELAIQAVCAVAGVEREQLCSPDRSWPMADLRYMVMDYMYDSNQVYVESGYMNKIGKLFNRDHSTVRYGLDKMAALKSDPRTSPIVYDIWLRFCEQVSLMERNHLEVQSINNK